MGNQKVYRDLQVLLEDLVGAKLTINLSILGLKCIFHEKTNKLSVERNNKIQVESTFQANLALHP